jgi:FKBP-type peptidyl-prolyl cis-trans isomerase
MCVGETRVIRAPPEFAFGPHALGHHVPGNATIKYQFDLVDVDPRATVPNHFKNCMHTS